MVSKRFLVILFAVVGPPILGWVGGANSGDTTGISTVAGFVFGIATVFVSLILGVIISFFARGAKNQDYSLSGYLIPSGLFVLWMLMIVLFH